MTRIFIPTILVLLLVACSDGNSEQPGSLFWDSPHDVPGVEVLPIGGDRDFSDLVWLSDAAVVAEITEIESTELPSPMSDDVIIEDPEYAEVLEQIDAIRTRTPIVTTYSADILNWLSGDGDSRVSVTQTGGVGPDDNKFFLDGSFLLEPGRTYLLLLTWGGGEYWFRSARTGFDLTDGVKVLNHETTRDLEVFEDMSVDEFVEHVSEIAGSSPGPDFCDLASGTAVSHAEFGQGFVVACQGSGSTLEVSVGFQGDVGFKTVPFDELSSIVSAD